MCERRPDRICRQRRDDGRCDDLLGGACNRVLGVCVPYWKTKTTVLADWLTDMVTDSSDWKSTSNIPIP
jgi:hypothetical protein